MDWDFSAASRDDLRKRIDGALLTGRFSGKAAIERLQMAHLLKSLALSEMLDYPLRVKHTTDLVPDFRLSCGKCEITVEMTRIKFQDLEHARAIQSKEIKSTLLVSALYPKPSGPRKKPAVIKDGFGIPAFVFSLSTEAAERVWLEQTKESLDAKTAVISTSSFDHGDEDWLVLLDPVGGLTDTETCRENLSKLLAKFWGKGWFSKVFVQDNYFQWQMVFSPGESRLLSSEAKEPPKHTFQIDESDAALFKGPGDDSKC